jgi:hypothetical protein
MPGSVPGGRQPKPSDPYPDNYRKDESPHIKGEPLIGVHVSDTFE